MACFDVLCHISAGRRDESYRNIRQCSKCLDRNSNQAPPEQKITNLTASANLLDLFKCKSHIRSETGQDICG